MTNANDDPRIAANLDEQLDHAAEELITSILMIRRSAKRR